MVSPDHRDGRAVTQLVPGGSAARNLIVRVASAAVLAPVVLLITYLGGWLFFAFCALAAAGILWEWTFLVARRAEPRILAPGLAALITALVLTGLNEPGTAIVAIAAGAALAGIAHLALPRAGEAARAAASGAGWAAGGVLYAGAAFAGPALLRRDPDLGFTALLFLFATVWITDTFAFFCGRMIGGPLLWPSVSPNKTWSGAIGGLAVGVAAAAAVAYASGISALGMALVMALLLSTLAQAGDLLESAVKRRFGAKDTSGLIPGHGGLMDRLDGFLVAALAALLVGILRQGMGAPAQGLLLW